MLRLSTKCFIHVTQYLNCINKRLRLLKIKRNRTVARKLSTWVCLGDKARESGEARGRYMFRRSSNFRRSAGSSRDFAKRSLRKKRSTRLRTLPVRDGCIVPRNCGIPVSRDQRWLWYQRGMPPKSRITRWWKNNYIIYKCGNNSAF